MIIINNHSIKNTIATLVDKIEAKIDNITDITITIENILYHFLNFIDIISPSITSTSSLFNPDCVTFKFALSSGISISKVLSSLILVTFFPFIFGRL